MFVILPRYKTRSEGEHVFADDVVILQSKTTGLFVNFQKGKELKPVTLECLTTFVDDHKT